MIHFRQILDVHCFILLCKTLSIFVYLYYSNFIAYIFNTIMIEASTIFFESSNVTYEQSLL